MSGEFSSNSPSDREAAQANGCLSVFLFPPFSVAFFGALLFFGLIHFPLNASKIDQPQSPSGSKIAAFFAAPVQHWEPQIIAWAAQHNLDPNLVATVMQIESCGDPKAISSAGAEGLFQVMPYHFASGENGFKPETNAVRGLNYLRKALDHFDNNAGLALAGYNGGISGASRPAAEWAQETRDYVYWGERIYEDASAKKSESATLDAWMSAGGASLCAQAQQYWVSGQ